LHAQLLKKGGGERGRGRGGRDLVIGAKQGTD
jgi:hypothetical protein